VAGLRTVLADATEYKRSTQPLEEEAQALRQSLTSTDKAHSELQARYSSLEEQYKRLWRATHDPTYIDFGTPLKTDLHMAPIRNGGKAITPTSARADEATREFVGPAHTVAACTPASAPRQVRRSRSFGTVSDRRRMGVSPSSTSSMKLQVDEGRGSERVTAGLGTMLQQEAALEWMRSSGITHASTSTPPPFTSPRMSQRRSSTSRFQESTLSSAQRAHALERWHHTSPRG